MFYTPHAFYAQAPSLSAVSRRVYGLAERALSFATDRVIATSRDELGCAIDWARAHALATQSWERGPKLGGLCRRNWSTIRFAAEARADAAAAGQAQQRVAACAVAPPNRF